MSLGKLLTTGKSLVGLHDSNARYQLRTGALPKFESSRNPFAKRPVEPEPEAPPQKLSVAETAPATMKKTQELPVLGEVRNEPKVPLETCEEARATAEVKAKEAARVDARPAPAVNSWVKKLNPLVWFQNRKPAEKKSTIPRFGGHKTPVQGELSLDNIKVMRNDLSETDVEVVPLKARPAVRRSAVKVEEKKADIQPVPSANGAAAMAIPELPPARNAWEFLGERILGKE